MNDSGKAIVTLPTPEQILITRQFDAPKHLVYKAWTTPDLVKRWWSGKRGEMKLVEIDLRVGGAWRYVMLAHGSFEVAFHGTFREIRPNERLVTTEVYEMPGTSEPAEDEVPINTITFTETNRRTTLTLLTQCPNPTLRDTIINSGMETGMQEQMDILEDLTRSLTQP